MGGPTGLMGATPLATGRTIPIGVRGPAPGGLVGGPPTPPMPGLTKPGPLVMRPPMTGGRGRAPPWCGTPGGPMGLEVGGPKGRGGPEGGFEPGFIISLNFDLWLGSRFYFVFGNLRLIKLFFSFRSPRFSS